MFAIREKDSIGFKPIEPYHLLSVVTKLFAKMSLHLILERPNKPQRLGKDSTIILLAVAIFADSQRQLK